MIITALVISAIAWLYFSQQKPAMRPVRIKVEEQRRNLR